MGNAKKLVSRAPRYILNPHELKMVRIAPRNRRRHQIYELEIIDMSESGMSFIVNWSYLPKIGEILKVEFPVPGENRKVAWFAEVVRLEGREERPSSMKHFSGIKVAVRFIDLPQGHFAALKGGLDRRFHDIQMNIRWEDFQATFNKMAHYSWEAGKVLLIIALASAFFYFITRDVGNYNPNRPVNWGERFFDRVIKK